ncbi:immunoglobulin domain-containing protein [Ditylenchus destructor]|nr:immunoglobulin domain-containing protein [Ditylenchus destructor]
MLLRKIHILSTLDVLFCYPNLRSVLFSFLLFSAISVQQTVQQPFAQGNLAIVFDAKLGRTSDQQPLHSNLTELWCQATETGEERLPVKSAKFMQVSNPSGHVRMHKAEVVHNRAHLHFGRATPSAAGKYKCEIMVDSPSTPYVTGNLFVYMRPIFHVNSSTKLDQVSESAHFHFTSTTKVIRGNTAILVCPAIGYPVPKVEWFKDNEPLWSDDKYVVIENDLHVDDPDTVSTYSCRARNNFPVEVDGPEEEFEAILDHHLKVSSSLAWLTPLILIIILLILLFITIYTCAWFKRYRYAQYNVAQKEKCLRKAEEQNGDFEDE